MHALLQNDNFGLSGLEAASLALARRAIPVYKSIAVEPFNDTLDGAFEGNRDLFWHCSCFDLFDVFPRVRVPLL